MGRQGPIFIAVASSVALAVVLGANAHAKDPKKAKDDTWISVSGTVVSTGADSFRLDHGAGVITVEMDDFDFYDESRSLLANDEVVVYGIVDDDLFEKKTIEASSVYVENLGTHYYASSADEEDFSTWTYSAPIVVGQIEATGTVTSIKGREFTLDTARRRIKVDTESLIYDPLDNVGYLQIDVGDRVKVSGEIENDLFEAREIRPDWLIELNNGGK